MKIKACFQLKEIAIGWEYERNDDRWGNEQVPQSSLLLVTRVFHAPFFYQKA